MTSRYLVEHETQYRYSSQVALAQHLAHLTPWSGPGQRVDAFALAVEPAPSTLHTDRDYFGNARTYFSFTAPHETLAVRARSQVALEPRFGQVDLAASAPWEAARLALSFVAEAPFVAATEYTFASSRVPRSTLLRDYAAASFPAGRPVLAGAEDLMHRIHHDFRYDTGATDVATPVLSAFTKRSGVCQDFSHVMIGCLRSLGLAARYVSGYLYTQARHRSEPGSAGQAAAPVVGAAASHAWVAVWCPIHDWVEFDPTNDAIPGEGHVVLATGRDYSDVAPLRGVVQGGGEHEMQVGVRVTAI